MRPSIVTWYPDTCGCVVECKYDADNPAAGWSGPGKITPCPAHASLSTAGVWTAVLDENPRKNKVRERSKQALGLTEEQAQTAKFSFDSSRKLIAEFGGLLTQPQKNNLQNWCDANLGSGKVKVN